MNKAKASPSHAGRLAGLALVALTFLAPPASAAEWQLATRLPEGSVQIQSLELFAQDLEQASGGRFAPSIYPGGSLGSTAEPIAAVQTGQVSMAAVPLSDMADWGPLFEADSVPTLAATYADARRLWEILREPLQQQLWSRNLILLFAAPQAPRGLLGPRDLIDVQSLAGSSIGASSPTAASLARQVGAQPVIDTDLMLAERYRSGGLTAAFLGAPEALRGISDERPTSFYPMPSWIPLTIVVMNKVKFETLSRNEQEMLRLTSAAAEDQAWSAGEAQNASIQRLLSRDGILVDSAPVAQELAAAGRQVASAWLERAGIPGQRILRAYRNP